MGNVVPAWISDLVATLRVSPGTGVTVPEDFDATFQPNFIAKRERAALLSESGQLLASYQTRLAAQGTHGVLLCLQGLDASGKDSTIRHVMSGVNPQGVHVSSFKEPSDEENAHDYLWRHARRLPARGEIGIFNRSHYEEVLVVRVHPELLDREQLPPEAEGDDVWPRRYREINEWERYLADNGIRVIKVLLNISKEKQRTRFLRRLDLPDQTWKFSAADIRERGYWDDYQHAFSEMLSATSTDWAPWYVIPPDRKWFAHICVSAVLVHALTEINPQYPVVTTDELRAQLWPGGRCWPKNLTTPCRAEPPEHLRVAGHHNASLVPWRTGLGPRTQLSSRIRWTSWRRSPSAPILI